MEPAHRDERATVEDLYEIPDDGFKYELEGGRLVREPLPGMRHGRVAIRLGGLLDAHVRRHGLGAVTGNDSGYVLARSPDTVRGPDVSFVRAERLGAIRDDTKAFDGAPDLAVEILSPSARKSEVHAKVADYLAAGTGLVWVIDPERREAIVYRSLLAPECLAEDDRLDGGAIVPGFSVAVRELFET